MARVATLLAVILNMVGFDTTTEINCQVSCRGYVSFPLYCLIQYVPKVWVTFAVVSASFYVPRPQYLILFILVFCLPRLFSLFAVDCASSVRLPCVMVILPKQRAQGTFAESPFGTGRRLLLQSQ
jgi:hypothetical protein